MTFIVGIKSSYGVVLCYDSLEDDGVTKNEVDKIQMLGATGWSVAMAGAGSGPVIDKFVSSFRLKMTQDYPFDQQRFESEIESELSAFNSKYIVSSSEQFSLIVAVCSSPFISLLYKADCYGAQNAVVLNPIKDKCHAGMGQELWRLLSDALYNKRNCVEDNIRLAVFATNLAIEYSARVGRPIQVVAQSCFDQQWKTIDVAQIRDMESEASPKGFKASVRDYWHIHTPPSRSEQVSAYGGVRTPGDELTLIDGVKVEELSTISGLRRSLKFLRHNRGKLQQRGNLLAKRYSEAHPDESQSSSDSADK